MATTTARQTTIQSFEPIPVHITIPSHLSSQAVGPVGLLPKASAMK
jgi:hypothetical protein